MELKQFTDWNRDIAETVSALGTGEFFPKLIRSVSRLVRISYPQIWLYHPDLPPRILYHEIPSHAVAAQIDRYLDGPYREDPFYQVSMDQPKSAIYRLSRITGNRLEESTYYRNYYSAAGSVDEAVFLAKLRGGNVINLSMMRLPRQGPFEDDEYQRLYAQADLVSQLIVAHSQQDEFAVSNLIQPGIDGQINLAFATFGTSILSPRERDVLELTLRGYGTEIAARKLGVAVETLRKHRKNIYRKLDVSSQTDLFALFINAMSCLAQAAGGDPLAVYNST